MKRLLLDYLACPRCCGALTAADGSHDDLVGGTLDCEDCGGRFPVVDGVPVLLADPDAGGESATSRLYSDIWTTYHPTGGAASKPRAGYHAPARNHVELLRLAAGAEIVVPGVGIDAGCGYGAAAIGLAARHRDSHVIGIDLSEGPLTQAAVVRGIPNLDLVRGDLLALPFAPERFDFVYSFGVLHHTPDPRRAFARLVRCLRPGGRITVFVYKDFSDLPAKRWLLLQVNRLRRLTTRLPPSLLRGLAWLAAPLVFASLTVPARVLRALGCDRLARHIPYGTFPGLVGIASSLEDRFGAPHEFRFAIADLERWAAEEALAESRVVDCLPWGFAGLVVTGRRAAPTRSAEAASDPTV